MRAYRSGSSSCPFGAGIFFVSPNANYPFLARAFGEGPATVSATGGMRIPLDPERTIVVEATFPSGATGQGNVWVKGSNQLCRDEAGHP